MIRFDFKRRISETVFSQNGFMDFPTVHPDVARRINS